MTLALTKPAAGSTNWGTSVNQNFTDLETALNRTLQDLPGLYGDGSDGNVTITGGTTTLTRDMYYGALTVTSTGVLATAGFRVYAKTSVTIDAGGSVTNAGIGGLPGTAGTLGGGAYMGSSSWYSIGGDGGSGDLGSGGTAIAGTSDFGKVRSFLGLLTGLFFTTSANTFVQGGAGGGPGSSGNGGGGGGAVLVATPALVNNGTIDAAGGNGAGGGGGGGGGVVFLAYGSKSGTGSVSVAGGTGYSSGTAGTVVEGGI